jgi:magnesium transporter
MEILLYREGAEKIETGFTIEQLPNLLKDEKAVIWVDMPEPTEADDQVLLNVFHFHPLTVEDCRETRNYPKVEEFPGYLYFIVHGVRADTSPDHFNTIELDAFLGANYVITYHHDSFPQHQQRQEAAQHQSGYLPTRRRLPASSDSRSNRRLLYTGTRRLRRAHR